LKAVGIWVSTLRFWTAVGIALTIVGIITFSVIADKKGWSKTIAEWFRSTDGTEATAFTILAILGLIYWKFPSLFPPIVSACFGAVLLMFIFELNRAKMDREGQNHWALFSIFILPLLPVLFTFFEYSNMIVHAVSTLTYALLIATLMGFNPNRVFEPRLFTQGTIYIIAVLIFFALVVIAFNKHVLSTDWSQYLSRIGMLFVTCATLALAVTMAIKFFGTNRTWSGRYFIMLIILIIAGAIVVSTIWKRLPHKSYFSYFSNANLVFKSMMLLSCWAADLMALIVAEPLQTWGLILVEVVLILWYAHSKSVFTRLREGGAGGILNPTGMMLQNDPLRLNTERVLPIPHNFRYNYAISCWVYLNAQPPNASPEATGFSNIVSYGGRPAVLFNAATNTMRITMRSPGGKGAVGITKALRTLADFTGQSQPSEEIDASSGPMDVLVADIPDVALQKWLHFVFFYTSEGKLDIFINGALYKSVAVIVTNESSGLTLGATNGNPGRIANVMFFQGTKNPKDALFLGGDAIDASTVHSLYNDFKGRDPPVVKRVFPQKALNENVKDSAQAGVRRALGPARQAEQASKDVVNWSNANGVARARAEALRVTKPPERELSGQNAAEAALNQGTAASATPL
jgi:hypothetical protein